MSRRAARVRADIIPFMDWTPARSIPRRPVVTYAVVGVCCVAFLAGPAAGLDPADGAGEALGRAQSAYFRRWGVVPREVWSGAPGPLTAPFTALFVHGNWFHLLGNLLFLFVFGGMVEERMGRLRFALFYVTTGYVAMLCYAAVHATSSQTLVGASGAISAVLGAFLCLFPRARVTSIYPFLLFLPLRFPAWVVLVFWLVLQWLASRAHTEGPGVAYLAHGVGFALGFLYAWARYRGRATVSTPAPATTRKGEHQP